MAFDPQAAQGIGDNIIAVYARAELYLIEVIRDAIIAAGEAPTWAEAQLLAIRQQRGRIQGISAELQRLSPTLWEDVTQRAFLRGQIEAEKELATIPSLTPAATVINDAAVYALAAEQVGRFSQIHRGILRRTDDIWRAINAEVTGMTVTGSMTVKEAAQRSFTRMTREGLGFFVDKAGRKWGLDTYAEMAVRTSTHQALRMGHTETMQQYGVDLVVISSHANPAEVCAPYENKILSLTGKFPNGRNRIGDQIFTVTASMAEAEAAGLHHPNAILGGDQAIDTFAGAVGASKGTYSGPAFTIRTAQGHMATVSPEHPILTDRGWRTAESLSVGDNVFYSLPGQGGGTGIAGESNLEDVPTTVEDEFASIKDRGCVTTVPAAGHNFNDDRQFLQGEIDIVVTDDCLLPVPNPKVIKETGEVHFVWPNVGGVSEVGNGSLTFSGYGVASSVAGSLPNLDPNSFKPADNSGAGSVEHGGDLAGSHAGFVHGLDTLNIDGDISTLNGRNTSISHSLGDGRAGDSQDPTYINMAIPGGMESDYIVHIDRFVFTGHAYDFQTVDGVYSINNLITHNCAHGHYAYVPGYTKLDPTVETTFDEAGYKATQKQRYLERQIRKSKQMESAATTDQALLEAKRRKSAYQAKLRDHIGEHDLPRRRDREQVMKPVEPRRTRVEQSDRREVRQTLSFDDIDA